MSKLSTHKKTRSSLILAFEAHDRCDMPVSLGVAMAFDDDNTSYPDSRGHGTERPACSLAKIRRLRLLAIDSTTRAVGCDKLCARFLQKYPQTEVNSPIQASPC